MRPYVKLLSVPHDVRPYAQLSSHKARQSYVLLVHTNLTDITLVGVSVYRLLA